MNIISNNTKIQTQQNTEQTNPENPNELIKKYYKVDFAKLARMVFSELENKNKTTTLFTNFPKEKVVQALQNPQKNEKLLRDLSNYLYILSSHYKRLCDYYAEMPLMDWFIEPWKLDLDKININMFKKQYQETLFELDNMDIKHEMSKVLKTLYREGIFYGYEYSTSESYFIQKLDPDYCRIRTVEDGVYNYEFNFQYFDKYPDSKENYPDEFQKKYNQYKDSSKNKKTKKVQEPQWIEIDSSRSICIKADETILYPFPPFAATFSDIYEIADYKSLKKASQEMQNYALLVGSVPYNKNDDTANSFALQLDTAIDFGNKITDALPDQVGFLLSVYDKMELFRLNDDKVGTDKVEEATNNFWSSTGVSKNLFADSGNTDNAMKYATLTDQQSVFNLLKQIERWLNRKLKQNSKKYKFKFNFLEITHFNRKDVVADLLKACQFGLPHKTKLYISLGGSQSNMSSMAFLENDILNLHDEWIPLQSSHTQNGDNPNSVTQGDNKRPSKEQTETNTEV